MNPRLLKYYNRELQHVREMGGEFAKAFPKIAGRLGLEGFECADPYVERLLEGFSFLAARVQLKIDAEFPRFTQSLLELVYPHYLAPVPSMAVVQYFPDLAEGALADGFEVPRHTSLRSLISKGDKTPCEYSSAHDVTLWPLELTEAKYFSNAGALATIGVDKLDGVKAGIRLSFRTTAGLAFDQLALERLPLFIRGSDELPKQIYEQLLANPVRMVVRPKGGTSPWQEVVSSSHVRRLGFEDSQSLLPYTHRSFQGYRLLQEYFAFPERFLFVELGGLAPAVRRCTGTELEIIVLLDRTNLSLENVLNEGYFALFCTPAINLFPRRADRIHLDARHNEYHVVPDRTRPMDFEVYGITEMQGHGSSAEPEQQFLPFYACDDRSRQDPDLAYFTVRREPRVLSTKQRSYGPRSSYVGSEIFASLVDAKEAPYSSNLKQLALKLLCTNRDLPLHMSVGKARTDFTLDTGAPVESVRCVAGPTKPRSSSAEGETAWRLVSHLSLNYLSLVDGDKDGAAALRELLSLYADPNDASVVKQIEGVKAIVSRPVIGRIPTAGPITFGRGLEITVTCEDAAFEGTGVFLLGAVLEEFLAKYVSINAFTETVIRTVDRGEVMRWPPRIGRRQRL